MISTTDIERARSGDMDTLRKLDSRGLSPAVGEDADAFATRLEALRTSLSNMEHRLSTDGQTAIDTLELHAKDRISPALYSTPHEQTTELYGFKCDWVPGFFTDPTFSWLFGGCTYSYPPDFFTVFIIGNKLRKKTKFLCYDRNEILAHELCHVARAGLNSIEYEEHFAYQTARTAFRRAFGGIMHSQMDSMLFLFACIVLVAAQILLPIFAPDTPFRWIGWIFFAAVMLFFVLRHLNSTRIFNKARRKLNETFRGGNGLDARMILFHATDAETREIANANSTRKLLDDYAQKDLRWKIALSRIN
ncbi:MAG: hypothetical protein MJ106_01070 [Lentisphaeria bacterium]|nr:hypothetical protein [Lentisphaeria bacterium]